MDLWNGYKCNYFLLGDRETVVVEPKEGRANGKWALKTEYFNAFCDIQISLLEEGYHIAHIKNITRWNHPDDTVARAMLAEYMHTKLGLNEKCVIIGMSCGGMQGVYFASEYPQYVSCMYLDAPVINLLSCPADMGVGASELWEEFERNMGISKTELLSYRNHPLDRIPLLVKNKIPIILVCGNNDTIVPYCENGKVLKDEYEKNNCIIKTIIKDGCGHHPHGLSDNRPIVDFINKYA